MDYHIQIKNKCGEWEIIASFQSECDCEDCKAFLAEKYEDYEFRMVDDG